MLSMNVHVKAPMTTTAASVPMLAAAASLAGTAVAGSAAIATKGTIIERSRA